MGSETLEQMVRAGERARIDDAAREERIANCEMEFSDGFLSSWSAGLTQQKAGMAASLLENGGKSWFWRCELIDAQTGELINATLGDGAYGAVWILEGAARALYGAKFISAHAKRKATMERKGVLERITLFEAEGMPYIAATGKGLSGASTARAAIRPADIELKFTGRAGYTREDAETHIETLRENGYGWQEITLA